MTFWMNPSSFGMLLHFVGGLQRTAVTFSVKMPWLDVEVNTVLPFNGTQFNPPFDGLGQSHIRVMVRVPIGLPHGLQVLLV